MICVRMSLPARPRGVKMASERWQEQRERLCEEIRGEALETASYLGQEAFSDDVMRAMAKVPRHLFVLPEYRIRAYENRPLPIGAGQTISQPYIVAAMTDLARVGAGDKVLEVGTGCGYQAAVLAELGCEVYSVERHESLVRLAIQNLREAGYEKVHVKAGDGSKGWLEAAPFQAILVTAAAEGDVPPALVEQLAPGGRIVIPIEDKGRAWGFLHGQQLTVLEKDERAQVSKQSLLPVAFVPLIESEAEAGRSPEER